MRSLRKWGLKKIKIYFERLGARKLIAEGDDRKELVRLGIEYIMSSGYTPNNVWSYWMGPKGEEYMDFGSWSAFLVLIKE